LPIPEKHLSDFQKYSNVFVETGSHKGKTIDLALNSGFEEIRSVEFDSGLYINCVFKYQNDDRVKLFCGPSGKILEPMIASIEKRIVFWLDAHYSGSGSSMDDKICPIMEELEAIKNHAIKNHIILVDDVRLFKITGRSINQFAGHFEMMLDDVVDKIKNINPGYSIGFVDGVIKNDVLVAIPPDLPSDII
jgi:hypothetical protein